jgi:stress response protein YsnF
VREPQAANRAVQEAELVISAMRDEINLTKQTVLRERVRVDKRRLEEQRTVGTDRRWEELAVDREDLQ